MGKDVGIKLKLKHGSDDDKQAGCMWGLVQVLDYHNWHSNVRRIIHYPRYEYDAQTFCDWRPETNIDKNDAYETQKLLSEEQSSYHQRRKRCRASKKRSLRARVKALIANDDKIKPKLQRTYSIHHLEDGLSKISKTNWKNPTIFVPKDEENSSTPTKADVFDIFKVDKELLLSRLQDSDKSISSFSSSAFGLKRFSKSRSFPHAELKPAKLESKHKEVWSLPKEATDRIGGEDGSRKSRHLRSSSLDKYARLFDNRTGNMSSSRSFKLTNEYGIAPLYFTRMHSLSYVDSYYSDLNFEGLVDNPSGNGSVLVEKHSSWGQINEDCERNSEIHEQSFVLDENHAVEPRIYQDLEHGCGVHDPEGSKLVLDDEKDETATKIGNSENDMYPKKESELDYVRNLLEQSGITADASEVAWHSSNELLGPQLFEEVEARWPHARGELTGCPDFYGCWHHQMLFDLVNEVLLELYDVSLPYYPKPLSSCCHVPPFPIGDRIIEEVCRSIGRLVDMKGEENEPLDGIVARDLDHNRRWMNLQLESEFVGLDIEDMIFEELVQEAVFS